MKCSYYRLVHQNNKFYMYHGIFYLNTVFNKVLRDITNWMRQNPSETVLISYQQEGKDSDKGCNRQGLFLNNLFVKLLKIMAPFFQSDRWQPLLQTLFVNEINCGSIQSSQNIFFYNLYKNVIQK